MTEATTTAAADTSQASATAASTAAATTATAATTTTTQTNDATVDWRDSVVGDDLKAHAKNFSSVADVVKGHFELRKKLSSAIVPPGKDAKPEEIAEYRKKLGIPDTVDGYKFVTVDGKEPSEGDKAFQKTMAATFHGANITAEQATALNKAWNETVAAMQAAHMQADKDYAAATEAALRKEWQGADYEANKTFANRAATVILGNDLESFRQIKDTSGRYIGDNPILLKALAKIGREMGEDGLKGVLTQDQRATMQEQHRELTNKMHAANDKGDRAEATRLLRLRNELSEKLSASRAA